MSVGNPGIVLMAKSWSGLEKGHAHLTSGGVQCEACLAGSPELELVLTSATQAADREDMFLARSGEAVLRVREVLAS